MNQGHTAPPIDSLPVEILSVILLMNSQLYISDLDCSRPISLSSVCRKWRQVCHLLPELWSTIIIQDYNITPLAQYFQLSHPRHLDIIIDVSAVDDAFGLDDMTNALSPHISRAQTMALRLTKKEQLETFVKAFNSLQVSHLQILDIRMTRSWELPDDVQPIFSECKALHTVKFLGPSFAFCPPLVHLRYLDTYGWSPSVQELTSVISACPDLHTLILRNFELATDSEIDQRIHAPSIRCFALRWRYYWHSEHCGCPVHALDMPSLETLELVDAHGVVDHFTQSSGSIIYPQLKLLRLEDCQISPEDAKFYASFTQLSCLELVHSAGNVVNLLEMDYSRLTKLVYTSLSEPDVPLVVAFGVSLASKLDKPILLELEGFSEESNISNIPEDSKLTIVPYVAKPGLISQIAEPSITALDEDFMSDDWGTEEYEYEYESPDFDDYADYEIDGDFIDEDDGLEDLVFWGN